jgi:hypothetical protein
MQTGEEANNLTGSALKRYVKAVRKGKSPAEAALIAAEITNEDGKFSLYNLNNLKKYRWLQVIAGVFFVLGFYFGRPEFFWHHYANNFIWLSMMFFTFCVGVYATWLFSDDINELTDPPDTEESDQGEETEES